MPKPRPKTKGHTRSCASKKKYETFEKAEAASLRGRWVFMQAYKCRKCGMFHYGHPSAKHLPKMAA